MSEHTKEPFDLCFEKLEAMTKQRDELLAALRRIAEWDMHDVSLETETGSNGVRDFYRRYALDTAAKVEGK